jgi:hypothetical protein
LKRFFSGLQELKNSLFPNLLTFILFDCKTVDVVKFATISFKKIKHMRKFLYILSLGFLAPLFTYSQCTFDPLVTGDTLLCPNDSGVLTTQLFDTYQWYKRPSFGGPAQAVAGAVFQSLNIDAANDAGYYFSVEVTLNGCTELSPEVLVDGWLFLPPFTIIEGDYNIGSSGELILCQGDTIFLISGLPYNTGLQWFNNGLAIAGANNDTLIVTTAGSYTFSGAPAICPSYVQNQFIPSDVTVINCGTGITDLTVKNEIFPNPPSGKINFQLSGLTHISITDSRGRIVLKKDVDESVTSHEIDVSQLKSGIYLLRASGEVNAETYRFIIQ